jgi:hypothetical protein
MSTLKVLFPITITSPGPESKMPNNLKKIQCKHQQMAFDLVLTGEMSSR